MKLKTKLFLSFSVIALVSASLGIFVSLMLYSKKIHQEAVADLEMLGRVAKHTYLDELQTVQNEAIALSNNQALKAMLLYKFAEKNFVDLLQKFTRDRAMDAVAVYDQQGQFMAQHANVKASSYEFEFLKQQSFPPTEKPNLHFINNQDTVYLQIAAPVIEKATIYGYLTLLYRLSSCENDLLVYKLADLLRTETALYLDQREINRKGQLPPIAPSQYDALQQGSINQLLDIDMYEGGYIRSFIPVENLNGQRIAVLGIGVPANRYVTLTQQAYSLFFSLLLACLVVAGILAYMLGRAILGSIEILTQGVQKIMTEQDLSHRITLKHSSNDELTLLASAFNRMTVRLHELVANLESMVEARTQEIVQLNARLKQENRRMGAELEIPRTIQRMILPRGEELTQLTAFDIACIMEAADSVGGDYYDILYREEDGGQIKIGIGDVTGHGLESGLLMLMVQVAVRTLFIRGDSTPQQFMDVLNQAVFHNVSRMRLDKNLTLALLDIDCHTGKTRITGQHEEILIIKNNQLERLDTIDLGFIVGLSEDISDLIACYETTLASGDGIVLYTDGITEALDENHKPYSVERLCQVIENHWQLPAEHIKDLVLSDFKTFTSQFKDDITLVILKWR